MDLKRKIPFSPPDISELEIEYVTEVLRSGWITTGPKTKLLEKKLSSWIQGYSGEGVPRCVCLSSATASLELSLRLMGIGSQEGGSGKDEVITCAYTYTSSASVVNHVGAKLVLVDCSNKQGCVDIDYDALENAITENTKAIIAVDLCGIPCDYDRIFEIVRKKQSIFKPTSPLQKKTGRIAVISDSAHALGASYKGKMVGTVADFSNFSFHAVKNFTTAEGGAIMWNSIDGVSDEDIYHRIQLYSLHGQSKDAFAKNLNNSWEYDIIGTWYKCNMTDITAGLGLAQFERYPSMLERRKNIISAYDDKLKNYGIDVLDHYRDDRISSGHLYLTRVPSINREQANKIMEEMAERGIATNVHYKPLPMHTAYKKLGFDINDYPNAFAKFENEITLPLHTKLSDEDVEYIIENYVDVLLKYIK